MVWVKVDADQMEETTNSIFKEIKHLNKSVHSSGTYEELNDIVKKFKMTIPLISALKADSMRPRHWKELTRLCGVDFNVAGNPKLAVQLDLEPHKFRDEITEITDQASKEAKMEKQLIMLDETWVMVQFQFTTHKGGGPGKPSLISMLDEDFEKLEEHQQLVNGMLANKCVS